MFALPGWPLLRFRSARRFADFIGESLGVPVGILSKGPTAAAKQLLENLDG